MTGLTAFLGVSALVIVMPGQDTALTIRNTLVGGREAGVFTAVGVSAGQAVWTIAASAGIGALLVASEPAFVALRVAGGAYLVFLGAQALWAAIRFHTPAELRPRGRRSRTSSARQGFLSNLGNPKMLAFFTSLLPQFAGSFAGLLALGLVFCALTLAWLSAYAVVVARAGRLLLRSRLHRVLDAVTGTVLVGLGIRLAAERR
jgi:threonine/homoserine/homoserine lactone efflux protein